MFTDKTLFENKVILITGATGTVGGEVFGFLFSKFLGSIKEIRVISRDEYKLFLLMEKVGHHKKVVPELGDIRDKDFVRKVMSDVDIVIHSAALKRVEFGELYPYELIQTNIEGTKNIVELSMESNVSKCFMVSTDKAVEPTSIYGATKLVAERIFISSNISKLNRNTKFSIGRFGNIFGSRGSLVDVLKQKKENNEPVQITDPNMTRFWISRKDVARYIVKFISIMEGGEIFIPKMYSTSILEVIDAIYPNAKKEEIGPRIGERIHEIIISDTERKFCFESDDYFVIYSEIVNSKKPFEDTYLKGLKKVDYNVSFVSKDWQNKEILKYLLENV